MLKPTQQEVDVFSEGFPQGHLVIAVLLGLYGMCFFKYFGHDETYVQHGSFPPLSRKSFPFSTANLKMEHIFRVKLQ